MIKTVDEDEEYNKVKSSNNGIIVFLSFIFGILLLFYIYFFIITNYVERKIIEIEQSNNKVNQLKQYNITLQKDEIIKSLE